jgi:hypothetical protein
MAAKDARIAELEFSVNAAWDASRSAASAMHAEVMARGAKLDAVEARIAELEAENFKLAAGQCVNATADEGGTPRCAEITRLRAALERIADTRNTHFTGDAQVVAREALAPMADQQKGGN